MKFNTSETHLINFLQEELAISDSFIMLALHRHEEDLGPLPMILWQYGLISLEQLEQIFDWLECARPIGDLLAGEYANELVYFCADGLF